MKLETVKVTGFRSVNSASLMECGGFNVLIGKNNSGKSNLLLAINEFFRCIKKAKPVAITTGDYTAIDHFQNRISDPIDFTLTFQLTLAERDSLIQDIVSEAPNVKNAIEGIDPELRLRVSVSIVSSRESFAFVRQLVLCPPQTDHSVLPDPVATILEIDYEAAAELSQDLLSVQVKEKEISYLNEMLNSMRTRDADEWRRLQELGLRRVTSIRAGLAKAPSDNIERSVDKLFKESETLKEFQAGTRALIDSTQVSIRKDLDQSLKHRIASFSGQEDRIPKYVTNLLERMAQLKILYLTERREPIGKREAQQLLQLKIKRGGPEKLRTIQQTVSSLLGVEIDAFQSGMSNEEGNAELDVDQFLVQVNGAGIREALRLILDYEFAQPDILLVEEPEIHLHPALETSMMRYMKNIGRASQIFITTHSTNFLDTAEMRNVYLISKDQSTDVQLINMSDAHSSIPKELGLRLSSVFMFDRLVFIEGPSDEEVLREWASTLNINLAHAGVGFVTMGGVRNLASYATESTISFLAKRQVRLWFVTDRDERDDFEVKRLISSLGERAKTVVLKRRELENYLVGVQALSEFIKLKRELSGSSDKSAPSPSDIAKALSSAADGLKAIAIERRAIKPFTVPIFADRKQLLDTSKNLEERIKIEIGDRRQRLDTLERDIEKTIKDSQQAVDQIWASRKLEIVPGDELLDETCKHFGVRFYKQRDSARLASLMSPTEIPGEIQDLLHELGQH